jgi:hypothetical protein
MPTPCLIGGTHANLSEYSLSEVLAVTVNTPQLVPCTTTVSGFTEAEPRSDEPCACLSLTSKLHGTVRDIFAVILTFLGEPLTPQTPVNLFRSKTVRHQSTSCVDTSIGGYTLLSC